MATPNGVQSLRTLVITLLVVGSLTTGCKKSGIGGSDVDPRDQYVGTYEGGNGSYSSTITIGSFPSVESGSATVTVTKSANPKELYIDISNRPPKLTAELNGADFKVVDKTSDQITVVINGQRTVLDGTYTATGVFGKDQSTGKDAIVINTVSEAVQLGTTIRRTESINGNRK